MAGKELANRVPLVDHFLGKPYRHVTTPTRGHVVVGPVGYLVFWLGELVASAFALFAQHTMSAKIELTRIMSIHQNDSQSPIHSKISSAME